MEKRMVKTEKQDIGNSFRFFHNGACEFYPCHEPGAEGLNCLFCYCPMYYVECLGEPEWFELKGKPVKDCSACGYPHRPENYETIVEYLRMLMEKEK